MGICRSAKSVLSDWCWRLRCGVGEAASVWWAVHLPSSREPHFFAVAVICRSAKSAFSDWCWGLRCGVGEAARVWWAVHLHSSREPHFFAVAVICRSAKSAFSDKSVFSDWCWGLRCGVGEEASVWWAVHLHSSQELYRY